MKIDTPSSRVVVTLLVCLSSFLLQKAHSCFQYTSAATRTSTSTNALAACVPDCPVLCCRKPTVPTLSQKLTQGFPWWSSLSARSRRRIPTSMPSSMTLVHSFAVSGFWEIYVLTDPMHLCVCVHGHVHVCACMSVCVCVCERERERERICVCVHGH